MTIMIGNENYVDYILSGKGNPLINAVSDMYLYGKDAYDGRRVCFDRDTFELSDDFFDLIISTINFVIYFESSSGLHVPVKDTSFLDTLKPTVSILNSMGTWEGVFTSLISLEEFLNKLDIAMADICRAIKNLLKDGNANPQDIYRLLSHYEVNFNVTFDCSLADMLYNELQGE